MDKFQVENKEFRRTLKKAAVEQPSRGLKELWEEKVVDVARKYPSEKKALSDALDSFETLQSGLYRARQKIVEGGVPLAEGIDFELPEKYKLTGVIF